MIYTENSSLQGACLHVVGNKSSDEGVQLSESVMTIDENIKPILTRFFISSFRSDERYCFFHHSGLGFNFVYNVACSFFENKASLYQVSILLANQLYNFSDHYKIKGGEFCVAYFKNVEVDGIVTDVLGLFKSENKDTFLRVVSRNGDYELEPEAGININKLDKGCLIFNTHPEEGYIMAVVDNTNCTEAKYWLDEFLQAKPRSDEYQYTCRFLNATKSFITNELPDKYGLAKGEQAELLDKTLNFFKEKDTFDIKDFNENVITDQDRAIVFNKYLDSNMAKHGLESVESFSISKSAVKKSSRSMRSVIKLDKNFHIYIHGGEGKIKRGYDPETGMEYYQLFFTEEE